MTQGIRTQQSAIEIIERNGFVDGVVTWDKVKEIVKDDLNSRGAETLVEALLGSERRVINYVHLHWGRS